MEKLENLLKSTLNEFQELIETGNVVGKPVRVDDETLLIPISKVSFGFVLGGGEYGVENQRFDEPPYANASGGGVTIEPLGFFVSNEHGHKFVPANENVKENKWLSLAKTAFEAMKGDD